MSGAQAQPQMQRRPQQPQQPPPSNSSAPEDFHVVKLSDFEGLNTKPQRTGINDQEMYWCDNFMPIGKNNLQALPGKGAAIFTAPGGKTLSQYKFFNIGSTQYAWVIYGDSTSDIITVPAGATVASNIYTFGTSVQFAQWGSKYILGISSNGYVMWDGAVLYQFGSINPLVTILSGGGGYVSAPTVGFQGGGGAGATATSTVSGGALATIAVTASGSGYLGAQTIILTFTGAGGNTTATATANLSGGGVASVTVVNGGTGYTNGAPSATCRVTIIPTAGLGSGATATATVAGGIVTGITVTASGSGYIVAPTVLIQDPNNVIPVATVQTMPFGIKGNAIETFSGRVWIVDGANIIFSAAGLPSDFNTGDGAGATPSTDSFLRVQYTALRQSNGFLYLIGDSSINYISGISTTGVPAVTTFSNLNVDPQVGTVWPDSVQVFGTSIIFANAYGVYRLSGGSATKISDALDGIFNASQSLMAGNSPHGAVGTIFGIKVYILLLTFMDLFTNSARNGLLIWDGRKWFTAKDMFGTGLGGLFIGSQESNANFTVYGNGDTTHIVPLFTDTTATLPKVLQTKLWDTPSLQMDKNALRAWVTASTSSANPPVVTVQVDNQTGTGTPKTFTGAAGTNTKFYQYAEDVSQSGFVIGMTITTTEANIVLVEAAVGEQSYRPRL